MSVLSRWGREKTPVHESTECDAGWDFITGEDTEEVMGTNEQGYTVTTGPCDQSAMFVVTTSEGDVLDFCPDHFDMYYSVMEFLDTVPTEESA